MMGFVLLYFDYDINNIARNNVVQAVLWDESTVLMYITITGSDRSSIESISNMILHDFVLVKYRFHGDFNQQFDYCAMDSSAFMAISTVLTVYLYC